MEAAFITQSRRSSKLHSPLNRTGANETHPGRDHPGYPRSAPRHFNGRSGIAMNHCLHSMETCRSCRLVGILPLPAHIRPDAPNSHTIRLGLGWPQPLTPVTPCSAPVANHNFAFHRCLAFPNLVARLKLRLIRRAAGNSCGCWRGLHEA